MNVLYNMSWNIGKIKLFYIPLFLFDAALFPHRVLSSLVRR